MPSLLLDTTTFLTYLRDPKNMSGRATERLNAASSEQIFVSVVSMHALRRMNRSGLVTDDELARLLEFMRPEQILPLDDETRLLATSLAFIGSRLDLRLIAATARRWRLTLITATGDYDNDAYRIDVVRGQPARSQ